MATKTVKDLDKLIAAYVMPLFFLVVPSLTGAFADNQSHLKCREQWTSDFSATRLTLVTPVQLGGETMIEFSPKSASGEEKK